MKNKRLGDPGATFQLSRSSLKSRRLHSRRAYLTLQAGLVSGRSAVGTGFRLLVCRLLVTAQQGEH